MDKRINLLGDRMVDREFIQSEQLLLENGLKRPNSQAKTLRTEVLCIKTCVKLKQVVDRNYTPIGIGMTGLSCMKKE